MRVLIADDDRDLCQLLAHYVEMCGHEVVETVSGGGLAAIRSFAQHDPDVVFLDLTMPQLSGATACRQMLSRNPAARIVFVTGVLENLHRKVTDCHASGAVRKPFDLEDVRAMLERCALPAGPSSQAA